MAWATLLGCMSSLLFGSHLDHLTQSRIAAAINHHQWVAMSMAITDRAGLQNAGIFDVLGLVLVPCSLRLKLIVSDLHLRYLSSFLSHTPFSPFPILITLQQTLEAIWPGQRAELSSTNSFSTGSVSCCVRRDTWLVPFEHTKGKGGMLDCIQTFLSWELTRLCFAVCFLGVQGWLRVECRLYVF